MILRPSTLCTLASATLLVSLEAGSDTPKFPAQQPVPVAARVALLEQRMHGLEQRLKAFEKTAPKERSDGSYELTMNGARVLIQKDGSVTVSPKSTSAAPPRAAFDDACDPPYTVDPNGIRVPKPDCAPVTKACDPPFIVDKDGNRRVKKDCN
jgi:hypothetical protein